MPTDLTAALDSVPGWVWAGLLALVALTLATLVLIAIWTAQKLARRPRLNRTPAPENPGGPKPLTFGQRRAVMAVGTPALALAVLGFALAYGTMSEKLEPTFGDAAGAAVVVIDLFIAVSSAAALLLIWIGIRISWLRLVPWVLITVSVALNSTAGTEWWEKLAHGAMPALWSLFVEVVITATGRRMKLVAEIGDRPRWGARWFTLPHATVLEALAWTNWPRDHDIEVSLAGAVEHLRRVRAGKRTARAERAQEGLGWWPWMRTRTHHDALSAVRADLSRTEQVAREQANRTGLLTTGQLATGQAEQVLHGQLADADRTGDGQNREDLSTPAGQGGRTGREQNGQKPTGRGGQTHRTGTEQAGEQTSGQVSGQANRRPRTGRSGQANRATSLQAVPAGQTDEEITEDLFGRYAEQMRTDGKPLSRYRVEQDGSCSGRQADRVLDLLANRWREQTSGQVSETNGQATEQAGGQMTGQATDRSAHAPGTDQRTDTENLKENAS